MASDQTSAWVTMMWCAGASQKSIARSIGYSQAGCACAVIKKFCRDWAKVDMEDAGIYGDERKRVAGVAIQNYLIENSVIGPFQVSKYMRRKRAGMTNPATPI